MACVHYEIISLQISQMAHFILKPLQHMQDRLEQVIPSADSKQKLEAIIYLNFQPTLSPIAS
jgi:hypothetical protein